VFSVPMWSEGWLTSHGMTEGLLVEPRDGVGLGGHRMRVAAVLAEHVVAVRVCACVAV
jgi:hypothetical protein